jgi:serine/threonine protein kinase, bacterial
MTLLKNDTRRTNAASALSPPPLESGYILDYPIGWGAIGRVWLARRRSDDNLVAIKVLREEYAADPDMVARFLRVRSTMQGLSNPHLVSVYDVVADGSTLAVVMELVYGDELRRVARRGGLDSDGVFTVLGQVAQALAHIHAAGVLHRDVKPENIMITRRDGEPFAQLTDFGLAWIADGRPPVAASHVVGTLAYLAPELLSSQPYGPAVDVYALGVTAYEMLCGQRPFEAESPLALMRAHLDSELVQPATVPDDAWHIVRSCLAKQPQLRPSAAQLATLFESLRDTPGSA